MPCNYKKLVGLYEGRSASEANTLLREAFHGGEFAPDNIDLGRLFEECYGTHHFRACRNREVLANEVMSRALLEADGAVSTTSFQNITGQIVYSTVLDKYDSEEFVVTKMIPESPTQFLDGEKIAGVTRLGDQSLVRAEGESYALAGVGEDWIFTPPVKDRGVIVPVTWEAVFADRTGQLLERAGEVGQSAGLNREKRAIDCLLDTGAAGRETAHRYNWRGTVIQSYNDNTGSHTFDNLSASTGLTDWTSVETVEILLSQITDPYTGEPYPVEARHLVVGKAKEQTARRIVHATEIRVATPGYATSVSPTQTLAQNPYANKYEIVTSRLLTGRLNTSTDWYLGDISKYAKYMVVEKMQVQQAPAGNQDEFQRRIVNQFRVNERGAYVVVQPRVMAKATA